MPMSRTVSMSSPTRTLMVSPSMTPITDISSSAATGVAMETTSAHPASASTVPRTPTPTMMSVLPLRVPTVSFPPNRRPPIGLTPAGLKG